MRRKRYQRGSLSKEGGKWIAQWWEDGRRRKRTIGRTSEMTESQACIELERIVAPLNQRCEAGSLGAFVEGTYLLLFRQKWKVSTARTTEERIRHHLASLWTQPMDLLRRDSL